jgi:hypothetical protein
MSRGDVSHISRKRPSEVAWLSILALLAVLVAGCSALKGTVPEATPLDFPGVAGQLAIQGLNVSGPVSGDAGCSDPTIVPTAIGFDLSGAGVTSAIHARIYIFGSREAYERRRPDVDACVAQWATDPATIEFVDASPYVLVVQGPVPPAFKDAARRGLGVAAGNGGGQAEGTAGH